MGFFGWLRTKRPGDFGLSDSGPKPLATIRRGLQEAERVRQDELGDCGIIHIVATTVNYEVTLLEAFRGPFGEATPYAIFWQQRGSEKVLRFDPQVRQHLVGGIETW